MKHTKYTVEYEDQYRDLLRDILKYGDQKDDRTEVGTLSLTGLSMRIDLKNGFPILTGRRVSFKGFASELLWILEGSTDERRLAEILYQKDRKYLRDKRTIWTDNAEYQGKQKNFLNNDMRKDLGFMYGASLRGKQGSGVDQLKDLEKNLRENPSDRGHLVCYWFPERLHMGVLRPCHAMAQFHVQRHSLDCTVYQRSADMFLGVPFNIGYYALWTHLLARILGKEAGMLSWTGGDCHLYNNSLEGTQEYLKRPLFDLPNLGSLPLRKSSADYKMKDLSLENYQFNPEIKVEMAV